MTFKEYYQHYLSLHQNKICRRLHVLGQVMTLTFLFSVLYLGGWWLLLLPLTPFIVYPFAWTGHFYFEKNKPAAFKNPLWAKASDWVMLFDIIRGKISF
jgi:hypothetical protein